MAPALKVSLGSSIHDLKEISYNDSSSHGVRNDLFDGLVSVHIKGDDGIAKSSNNIYFEHESRTTRTWSIRIQGRFLQEINGNDILFGNAFDRPLSLPWGFGAALNFVQYVDPTLEHDLYGEKPWAFSPFLSTMPYLQREQIDTGAPPPKDTPLALLTKEESKPALAPALESDPRPTARRKHFTDEANRKAVTLTPRDLVQADFVHGYLQFPYLTFSLPGGVQFDLMSYYDERPVHFVCKKRGTEDIFFVVSFTVFKDGCGQEQDQNEVAPMDSSDID